MQFFVGTSGYSYPKWKGSFYPTKIPRTAMLSYYAAQFAAVEINNSFYKLPSKSDVRSWADQTPQSFRFAFKAPQTITHFKRLANAEAITKQLFKTAATLKARRGPVLSGLPPNFKKDVPRFKTFLKMLPKRTQVAFEFRHPSWFDEEVYDCLRSKRMALCIADTDDMPRNSIISTAPWGYLRLRREHYTPRMLAKWVERIKSQDWDEVFVFFRHEDTGTGPKFAARFLKRAEA